MFLVWRRYGKERLDVLVADEQPPNRTQARIRERERVPVRDI
jgi:hypothetical protein